MFCKKCGADAGDGKFCPSCGEPVEEFAAEGFEGKTVNKIAYGLIAIFVGWLGIHRFYAGKTLSGVLYIVLDLTIFGIFITSLLGLIEGILALTRKDIDSHGNIPVYEDKFFV